MDFQLTEEQKAVQNSIRKFLARECTREAARALDDQREFPVKLFETMAQMGICGLTVPEEFEGVGPDTLGAIIAIEEIATINPALAGAFIASAFCGGKNISALGNEEQKKEYFPGLAAGKFLFTYGITEEGSGYSGIPSITTTAVLNGDGFTVNGSKNFVRMADRADHILTLARTGNDQEFSFLIIDMKSPGININSVETVGYKSLGFGEVIFSNVFVPRENLLGGFSQLHLGLQQLNKITESEHLEIAASSLGIAQGAYEYASNYARERVQFGRPIVKFEAVQEMLVDMAMSIQIMRVLTYQAGWLADNGVSCLLEAAMARTYAINAVREVCFQALQILGGYGYAMEYDIQRYVRDSLVLLGGGKIVELLKASIGQLLNL